MKEQDEGLHNEKGELRLYQDTVDGKPNPFFTDAEQMAYHKAYFDKFIAFNDGPNGLFENPEKSFLASSTPGNDGSELIIENMEKIWTEESRFRFYSNILKQVLSDLELYSKK